MIQEQSVTVTKMANKQASRGRAITTVEELIVRHPAPTLRLRMPTRQRNTNSNLSSGLVLVGLAAPQILQRETSTSALDQQNTHFSVFQRAYLALKNIIVKSKILLKFNF